MLLDGTPMHESMADALQKKKIHPQTSLEWRFSTQIHLLTHPLRVRVTGIQGHDSPIPVEVSIDITLLSDYQSAYDADAFCA